MTGLGREEKEREKEKYNEREFRKKKNVKKNSLLRQSRNTLGAVLGVCNIRLYALLHPLRPVGDVCRVQRVSATCPVCTGQA